MRFAFRLRPAQWFAPAAFAAVLLAMFASARPARAEGSANLVSSGGNRPFLEYRQDFTQNSTIRRLTRVFVYANTGETLLVASSTNGVGNGRLGWRAPDGAQGSAPRALTVQGKQVGLIANLAQEMSGPLPNAGGYRPYALPVGAGQTGVWELSFVSPDTTSTANPVPTAAAAAWTQITPVGYVAAWDVTVRSAAGTAIPGRAFVNQLAMNVGNAGVAMSSQLWLLTRDGFRYRVDANGVQPFGFNFFANNKGFRTAGGLPLYRSVALAGSNIHDPDGVETPSDVTHKLFFNVPSADLPASAPTPTGSTWLRRSTPFLATASNFAFVGVDGTPNQAGSGLGGTFSFDSDGNANYRVLIDLNGNSVYTDAIDRALVGVAVAGANAIVWDGLDGLGAPAPVSGSPSQVRARIELLGGEVHFPYIDAEDNPAGIVLERQNGPSFPDYTVFFDDRTLGGAAALPPAGASSAGGAHLWNGAFGDIRGMDSWTYVPGAVVNLVDVITIRSADLELVSKTHAPQPFVTGQFGTYTFVVRNNGPDSAYAAAVVDTIPAALLSPVANVPAPTGGATVLSSGMTGQVLNASLDLPPGSTVTFEVSGVVSGAAPPSVINRAFVLRTDDSGDLDDQFRTGAGNNGKRDTATVIVAAPDLAIDKRHTADISPGAPHTWTLVVSNVGTGPATGPITVADTLPAGVTFVSGAGAGWTFTPQAPNAVVATHAGPIAPGDSLSGSITTSVAASAWPGVTNAATITGPADGDPANDRDTDPTPFAAGPDLRLDKRSAGPFTSGQNGTYELRVTNLGTVPTTGTITITDTLATGLAYVGVAGAGWSGSAAGPVVTLTSPGPIAPGPANEQLVTMTVAVGLVGADSVGNFATVSGGGDTTPGDNRDGDRTPVSLVNLALDKRHAAPFVVGQNATYTLVVTNLGNAPSTGTITVLDTLPAGLAYVSASGGGFTPSVNGAEITLTRAAPLAAGDSAVVVLTVLPGAPAVPSVTNAAQVSGGGDADPRDDRDTDPTSVGETADLVIDKRHTGSFTAGQFATWRIRVTNVGAGPTAGTVTVVDTLPASVIPRNAFGSAFGFNFAGQVLTAFTTLPIDPGDWLEFDVVVEPTVAAAPQVVNAATVSGGGETNTGNNADRDTAVVNVYPNLVVDKRHVEDLRVGVPFTWTVVATNVGLGPTTGTITVRDTLPAGVTFVSASGAGWSLAHAAGVVTATSAGPIAGADSSSFSITVVADPSAWPGVNNSAWIEGGGELDPDDNGDTDPTPFVTEPDLVMRKASRAAFVTGANGTYDLDVINLGTAPSAGTITVSDTLPAGLAFVSGSGSGWTVGATGNVVTATTSQVIFPGFANAKRATVVVSVSAPAEPSVANFATVAGGGDVEPGNNRDGDTTAVGAPDLTIDKRHTTGFTVGQNGTYTLVVRNVGSNPTSGAIVVRDTLPAGLAYVSAAGGGFTPSASGAEVTLTRAAAIAAGDSAVVTLVVSVSAPAAPQVTNSATVSGGGDTTPGNDRDSDLTPVAAVPDLALAKASNGAFLAGGTGSYTITVTNVGSAPTSGTVTVRDTLPAGLTYAGGGGADWTLSESGGVVTATRSTPIAATASAPFTLDVAIAANAPSPLVNAAVVSGGGDTNPGNDRGTDSTPVGSAADLALFKRHAQPFVVGSTGTWTLTVRNVGATATTGTFTVTDTLPAGIALIQAQGTGWTQTSFTPLVMQYDASLAAGDSATFTVEALASSPAAPQVTNAATVAGGGDVNPANDRATDPTPVLVAPDLAIEKTTSSTFAVGARVVYDINVTNVGSAATTGTVTVVDTLPNGLVWVNAAGNGWSFQIDGRIVTATTPGPIGVLQNRAIAITADVTVAALPGVTNSAVVAGGGDANPLNNRSSVTRIFGNGPDLSVAKRHDAEFARGGSGRWTIVVRNTGVTSTTGTITVTDALPSGVTYQSANGAGWGFSIALNMLTATRTAALAVGDSAVFTVDVAVASDAPATVNNVAVVSTPGDVNATNNTGGDVVSLAGISPLVVEKTASPEQVEVGGVVDYRIGLRNTGSVDVTNVSVTDVLPPGFTYVAGSTRLDGAPQPDPMGSPGPSLSFTVGTVPATALGGGFDRILTYRVAVGVAAGAGRATNVAVALTPDGGAGGSPVRSNASAAAVQVRSGVFGDRGIIAGKVWSDCDCAGDGRQGHEDVGIPGVRVMLEDGTSAITDAEGKYSFTHVRPRLHVVRVDMSTMPPGSVMKATGTRYAGDGRSKLVDLKAGEFHRADFAEGSRDERVRDAIRERRTKGEPWAAMTHPDSGAVLMADALASPEGKGLALVVPQATPPADGRGGIAVRWRPAPDAGGAPVTLEASAGRWLGMDGAPATDADSLAPGLQVDAAGAAGIVLQAPSRPQDVTIRVTQGDRRDSAVVRFVPEFRPLLVSGLLEGRLDLRSLGNGELNGLPRDRFEDALRDASFDDDEGKLSGGARGAVIARGEVAPGVQLTGRFDSEADPDGRLFRDIRPFEGYDVTGDAAQHEWDAQSTSRLYLRLDRGASFAQFGDYVTPVGPGQKLGAFMRTFNGGLARATGGMAEASGFVAQGRSRQVVDEIRGLGVSGPYALSRSTGLLHSEQVELVTRDRNQPSRILSRQRLARFTDYTIEPFSGALMFRRPIPSLDGDLNPVSVLVTYETDGAGEAFWTYGGSLRLTPEPRIAFGLAASRDEDPLRPGNLASADLTLMPLPGVQLQAEFARSDSGTSFLSGDRHGDAWRSELAVQHARLTARAFALRAETGFENASAGVTPGRQELGGSLRVPFGAGASAFATALRTEDLATEGRRDGVEAGLAQRFGPLTAEAAYRWASETASRAVRGTTGVWPGDVQSVRGKLGLDVGLPASRRATLYGELEQDLDVSDRRRWGVGGEAPITERTRLYLRHENIASFAGPFALNDREQAAQTVFGIASDELREGHVFSEYRARSAFPGRETEAAIGLRNRWTVAPGLRFDASYENVRVVHAARDSAGAPVAGTPDEAHALTLGSEWTAHPLWKVTLRGELRSPRQASGGANTVLLTAGVARKLDRDWTGLGRASWFTSDDGERTDRLAQLGLAWRPTDRNGVNALARYENRLQADESIAPSARRSSNVLSAHLNVQPRPRFTVMGQTAAKWASDEAYAAESSTNAQLLALRGLWDLTGRFDAGLAARGLFSRGFDEKRFGAGAEFGAVVAKGLRASLGWNVFGFRDADLASLDHTDQGPYLQFGWKFDEDLFRAAGASK